mmetsp:Transcript_13181/g.19691  ORF Transcript_13181/g.19691 Transcript_13181/m.19691 type:complete len:93 (-) Transcript_13181:23-301(-)
MNTTFLGILSLPAVEAVEDALDNILLWLQLLKIVRAFPILFRTFEEEGYHLFPIIFRDDSDESIRMPAIITAKNTKDFLHAIRGPKQVAAIR